LLNFFRSTAVNEEYESCLEFKEIYIILRDENNRIVDGYYLKEEYLFQDYKLCISKTSMCEFFIQQIHAKGLSRHFRRNKIIKKVKYQFFWSSIKRI
jgi:hypothetical protein